MDVIAGWIDLTLKLAMACAFDGEPLTLCNVLFTFRFFTTRA
jgi:hypothetical protein